MVNYLIYYSIIKGAVLLCTYVKKEAMFFNAINNMREKLVLGFCILSKVACKKTNVNVPLIYVFINI